MTKKEKYEEPEMAPEENEVFIQTPSKKIKWDVMSWVLLVASILVLAFGAAERNRVLMIFGGIFLTLFIVKILFDREE